MPWCEARLVCAGSEWEKGSHKGRKEVKIAKDQQAAHLIVAPGLTLGWASFRAAPRRKA
jgi:hypothetical protein